VIIGGYVIGGYVIGEWVIGGSVVVMCGSGGGDGVSHGGSAIS
jgi:hypothetical protein